MTLETGEQIVIAFWEQQKVSIASSMEDMESASAVIRSRARRDLNQSQERICRMLGLDRQAGLGVPSDQQPTRYVIDGVDLNKLL